PPHARCARAGRARAGPASPGAAPARPGLGPPRLPAGPARPGGGARATPRQAKPPPARKTIEPRRSFHRLVKWRTGCEGRISYLKRGYGWDRTRLDGKAGAAIWCGHGVFGHNLTKIAAPAS